MSDATVTRADILAVADPRFAQRELAREWFESEPLPGFGTSTAQQLVDAGRGQEVIDFIAAVDAAIFA